jgi:hypothetical protein
MRRRGFEVSRMGVLALAAARDGDQASAEAALARAVEVGAPPESIASLRAWFVDEDQLGDVVEVGPSVRTGIDGTGAPRDDEPA